MKQRIEVQADGTLLAVLYDAVAGVPRHRIKIQLKRGEVRVNGKKAVADVPVNAGDSVEIFLPAKVCPSQVPIVYEDKWMMVADKPPYLESEHDLPALIRAQTGRSVSAVHRLDTNTTGLIMLAKSATAAEVLIDAFRKGQVGKIYCTRVFGCPPEDRGRLTAYLRKDSEEAYCRIFPTCVSGSKQIVTEYKVLRRGEQSVLQLSPVTGRTHQLRAHMAYIGCPIVGDDKYGDREHNRMVGAKRQKLRAVRIVFGEIAEPLAHLRGKSISVDIGEYLAENDEIIFDLD